jgi:hypothetical protein
MVTIQAAPFLKDAAAELGFVACAAAALGRIMDSVPTPNREDLQFNDRQLAN